MANGTLPFENPDNPVSVQEAILQGEIQLPGTRRDPFLKQLCQEILNKDPFQRPLWEDLKNHRYFYGIDWKKAAERGLEPPYKPNPMKY